MGHVKFYQIYFTQSIIILFAFSLADADSSSTSFQVSEDNTFKNYHQKLMENLLSLPLCPHGDSVLKLLHLLWLLHRIKISINALIPHWLKADSKAASTCLVFSPLYDSSKPHLNICWVNGEGFVLNSITV